MSEKGDIHLSEIKEGSKPYKKSVIIKLYSLFIIGFALLIGSLFLMKNGAGKFSSETLIFSYVIITVSSILISVIFLIYHTLKETTGAHFKKHYRVYDLTHFILLSVMVVLFFLTLIFKTAVVSGTSMDPTLKNGDTVIVWQFHNRYKYNDIVVMDAKYYPDIDPQTLERKDTVSVEKHYVKRIKGLPGQKIHYEEVNQSILSRVLHVYVDDVLVQTIDNTSRIKIMMYVIDHETDEGFIPQKQYLLFGDNIEASKDSRVFGFVSEEHILGYVNFRVFKKPGVLK